MWLTLPHPFAGRFHGSSWAWNSVLVVRLDGRSWNGALGGCVPLTGSQLSAPAFFGHGSSLEGMWLSVMSTERETPLQRPESFDAKRCEDKQTERERGRGSLFLISPDLVNYIGQGPPSQWVNTGALRGRRGFSGVRLPSAGKWGSNMQTKILTHDATLECCCGVFKEDWWEGVPTLWCSQDPQTASAASVYRYIT